MKKRIGLDCDGVLSRFEAMVLPVLNARLGTQYRTRDWHTWAFCATIGPEAVECLRSVLQEEQTWLTMPKIANATQYVKRLWEVYDEIYIITSIDAKMTPLRAAWLARHDITYTDLIPTNGGAEKAPIASKLQLDAFVDDLPSTCADIRDVGIRSLMPARHWNAPVPGVVRDTWPKLLTHLGA